MKQRCSYCGSNQHTARHCPKTAGGQANRRGLWCTYCGSNEHSIMACPKNGARRGADPDEYVKDRR